MKAIKIILFLIGSFIAVVLLTIVIALVIGMIQEKVFVPQDYLMWIFKYPFSRFVFVYELYFAIAVFYTYSKYFSEKGSSYNWTNSSKIKRYKKLIITTFVTLNLVLFYMIITAVTVITSNKIIDHSFLSPQGREYSYTDVVKINSGVHGKNRWWMNSSFTHAKGDFFYLIELNDGTRIDLAESGGTKQDDPRFILEELDKTLVNMGIPKQSSMENFQYINLGEIYKEKIRNILENVN
ncbi:hypothetical protein AB6A23_00095 [Paenibacillus tarimensis]